MADPANLYGAGSERKPAAGSDQEQKAGRDPLAKRYLREVERYRSATRDWCEEGENIVKLYMNEASSSSNSTRRFALLWANVETLKPAIYIKPPTVLCSRRFKDRDPVARTAAELMERATNTSFELYGVNEIFRMVRDDRLLPGRGQAWVRYEAQIDQVEETVMAFDAAKGIEALQTEMREQLRGEKVCVDYVHWQDFGHNVARTWADVWLVWRCVYKTQDEVADRFGGKVAARLNYSAKAPLNDYDASTNTEEGEHYCKIYEFWDRQRNLTSWLADGEDIFLESGEPPINFSKFFPCPEPCYATKTSKSLIPKPDYCYYRDQAKEINDLTDKIHRLTEWLIVKGFIPGGPSTIADPLEEALRDKGNKELFVQVDSMSEWTEKGGASKLIDWLPVQNVVATLQAAISARGQLIQDVFQITGIADILRGQSDPNETYGAVELRSQTGTRRLRSAKDDIARFCCDVARLSAEVIAENFTPKSIAEITGFKYLPPAPVASLYGVPVMQPAFSMPPGQPQGLPSPGMVGGAAAQMPPAADAMVASQHPGMAMGAMGHNGGPDMFSDESGLTFDDSVMELLRNDRLRSFRVDIETDSTVQADENAEREARTQFLESAGSYLERAVKIVQVAPALAKTAGELLMFGTRSFRPGRNLEETLERDFAALVKQAEEAKRQPPPEDPVVTVAKTQVAGEIEKNRANAALKEQEIKTDAALEVRKQDLDANLEIRKQNMTAAMKARDHASRMMNGMGRQMPARPMPGQMRGPQ